VSSGTAPIRVALAGFGAVGMRVAEELDKGIPGFVLTAVSARDRAAAAARMDRLTTAVPVVAIEELEPNADLVLECAPAALLPAIARPVLDASKTLMVLSVAALLDKVELIDLAQEKGGRIVVPTGALLGLDAVLAASEGELRSVRMITRKPPQGLAGAPYLVANDIDVADIREPVRVFEGSAREAGRGFPANVNVAVALSLAGIGPDRTRIEIWADPTVKRNVHRIEVDADSASFSMAIEGVPSENPKTGRITALSAIAALRKMTAPLAVGT
jgi:aspartate dehydrogenase